MLTKIPAVTLGERLKAGSVDWSDEHSALGEEALAQLNLPLEDKLVHALIQKHAPKPDHGPHT